LVSQSQTPVGLLGRLIEGSNHHIWQNYGTAISGAKKKKAEPIKTLPFPFG